MKGNRKWAKDQAQLGELAVPSTFTQKGHLIWQVSAYLASAPKHVAGTEATQGPELREHTA